ncbi:hypothetical protein [Endozoicomonas euniceicola]|uniref:Uncharacterized protein n=1 Tax=Endozoicomonas euniceicola TaxID=1234143 RepID=A0ABY6GNE6_9GAMM|nr:hypothetical protein [Endozoicomonas euniceicola]UYM14042.1 hypothetical protein NX720_14095 [Endozoicomonas euniceicola]
MKYSYVLAVRSIIDVTRSGWFMLNELAKLADKYQTNIIGGTEYRTTIRVPHYRTVMQLRTAGYIDHEVVLDENDHDVLDDFYVLLIDPAEVPA